jgi:hypothetical protein
MFKRIYISLAILFLVVVGFISGYYYNNIIGEGSLLRLPEGSYIQELRASMSGEIVSIYSDRITLEDSDKKFDILINEKTKIFKISINGPIEDGMTTTDFDSEEIVIEDLSVGQIASVFVIIDKDGNMTATNISITQEI